MKKTLAVKSLGEVCGFVRGPFGGSLKKECFVADGYAVYEQQHAIYNQFEDIRYFIDSTKFNEMKRFELLAGDLIMSCSGTMGRVAIVPNGIKKGVINQALLKLTPQKGLNTYYLKYWMDSPEFMHNISLHSKGAAIKNVASVSVLKTIPIPLPPLSEQEAIVAILDEAFAAIDKAKQNLQRNLQNTKELFESYLQGVFEEKGEGWEEKTLSEVCKLINGRAYSKAELLSNGKYTVLRVGNFFTNNNWYYSDLELDDNKYCDNGDLLYAWSASFGPKIWNGGKVIYHYHIWKVIPNILQVTKDFLFLLLSWDKEKIKAKHGTGTTMIHISKGSMESRVVPIPPIERQNQMVEQLNDLKLRTQKLEAIYQKKLDDLEELKKSILHKAFSGELKISEPIEI